jgi:hypothetical protein
MEVLEHVELGGMGARVEGHYMCHSAIRVTQLACWGQSSLLVIRCVILICHELHGNPLGESTNELISPTNQIPATYCLQKMLQQIEPSDTWKSTAQRKWWSGDHSVTQKKLKQNKACWSLYMKIIVLLPIMAVPATSTTRSGNGAKPCVWAFEGVYDLYFGIYRLSQILTRLSE